MSCPDGRAEWARLDDRNAFKNGGVQKLSRRENPPAMGDSFNQVVGLNH